MLKINLLQSRELSSNKKSILNNKTWTDELKNSFRTNIELGQYLNTNIPKTNFPIFITKAFAKRIKIAGPSSSLWKQFIPTKAELENELGETDPIGDNENFSSNQLIHRYKNRALFLPNINCPIHCRFCFRQHNLNNGNELFKPNLKTTINYLQEHKEINELIFSGGDPFLLSDDKLYSFFNLFRNKTDIKYIRIHSKSLTTLPSRYTNEFIDMLKASSKLFKKFIIVFHCNHIDELDENIKDIIKKLKNSNIELLLQSVLLKNINDDLESLKKLFLNFSDLGVRPYYLHHTDRVKNAMHFYLSIEEGRLLYQKLRDELPGWAIPQYVIDLPNGVGKTPLFNPENYEFSGTFIDKNGDKIKYL